MPERHQQPGGIRCSARVVHDGANAGRRHRATGVDPNGVAGPRAQLVRALRIQVDLASEQVGQGESAAVRADVAEAAQAVGRAREQRHARLVLPARDVLDRDGLDDHRRGGSDGARARTDDDVAVAGREEAPAGRAALRREGCADAVRSDDFVRSPERAGRRRADRAAHRVARRERGRDDRRPEHQAGDDQRGARAAAADVTDAEAQEDPVAHCKRADDAEREAEQRDEHGGEPADRDAEDLGHGALLQPIVSAGASASTSS